MKKLTKRIKKNNQKIEQRFYEKTEAIKILKETANAQFIESVEVHIALYINPKYSDQQLRNTLILPKGIGKSKRIAALVPIETNINDFEHLAYKIGSDDLIEEINQGKIDFDILIFVSIGTKAAIR